MKQESRVILRDWLVKDLDEYAFWNTGKRKWMDYDAPYYSKPSAQETQRRVEEYERKISHNDWPIPRKQLVIASKNTDELIGTVSWYWQSEETNWKSIGIALYDEHHWGKGLGYEALYLWVTYLFRECKEIVRLDLRTWSGNKGMMRLAEKLGFREEARFRKARIVDGCYYDSIGMGILREEWEQKNSTNIN